MAQRGYVSRSSYVFLRVSFLRVSLDSWFLYLFRSIADCVIVAAVHACMRACVHWQGMPEFASVLLLCKKTFAAEYVPEQTWRWRGCIEKDNAQLRRVLGTAFMNQLGLTTSSHIICLRTTAATRITAETASLWNNKCSNRCTTPLSLPLQGTAGMPPRPINARLFATQHKHPSRCHFIAHKQAGGVSV